MDVGRWTSEGYVSPRTTWEPCEACSWKVGPFWGPTNIQFALDTNIGGEGSNCKFSNLFLGVWCVTKFEHLSMHLDLTYSLYQLWGLGTDGVWILLAHWIWHFNITNMFWLWLNISPNGWSWFHCRIVIVKKQHMHFWTRYLIGLGLQPKFSLTKVQKKVVWESIYWSSHDFTRPSWNI